MLTDSSLTNTLTLSGINNIRYRVYTESYQKTHVLSFLTCQNFFHTKSPFYVETEKLEIALITAFRHLLALNIPSSWHIVPCAEKDFISLELWVFWFDNRKTGLIDNHTLLKDLKEVKMESFNWEQLSSSGLSPTASPQLGSSSSSKTNSTASLTPGNEYKLFIKSMRNLIHTSMIEKKNAFELGEFYVYPNKQQEDIIDTIADNTEPLTPPIQQNTMLACMYNIYLTSSNLVFQPNVRRMRIRPLIYQDSFTKHKKVLLCPTGEHAYLISFRSLPTSELQEKVLNHWAKFYHLSVHQLKQQQQKHGSSSNNENNIPFLVNIKIASDEIITYPSRLVFVSTDTKLTPSSVSGLNGIMGFNHGLAEDLGAKTSRHLKQQNSLDYLSWSDPMMYSGNVVIHALSMMDTNYQQDQILLQRALLEPVISSPIMNMKRVIPINTTSLLGNNNKRMMTSQHPTPPTNVNYNTNLADFAKSQFQLQKEESVEVILDGPNPLNNPNIAINNIYTQSGASANSSTAGAGSSHASGMQKLAIDSNTVQPEQQTSSRQQSLLPTEERDAAAEDNVPMNDFSLMCDLNTTNNAYPWDTNEGFGDLDLDVTEADFDFFKTSAPAPATLSPKVTTPSNILGVIPMDIVPTDAAAKDKSSYSDQKEGEPMIIEELTTTLGEKEAETTEVTPNNDSLFTPFVISNTSTEDISMESSNMPTVESSTPSYLSQSAAATTQQRNLLPSFHQRYAAVAETTTSFVPRGFLPIPINTNGIDAKYSAGGKFMYDPSPSQQQQNNLIKKRESLYYSADYVPKRKVARKRMDSEVQEKNPSPPVTQDVTMHEVSSPQDDCSSSRSSSSSNSSSDTTIGSSSSSSSEDNDEDQDLSAEENLSSAAIDKRFRTLKKFQKSIIYSLLKATPAPQPTDRFQHLDYDIPFAPILACDKDVKPIQWRSSQAMEQSLTLLCQQALGYPFADGLPELSQNGGEIQVEPTKIIVARRTNLMQITRGVVTHVPCLQTDRVNLILEFKDLLKQLFENRDDKEDVEVIESEAGGGGPPRAYLDTPLLGSVDVKGPLTIQQYFDLSESQNRAHSKYGKYQIKTKKPDELNLATLQKPNIVVSRYDDFLEGKSTMIRFWEKIGLEPYSSKKQVQYLVMYPENSDVEEAVKRFFKSLGTVYDDACRLGRHEPLEKLGTYCQGLVPVPLSASSKENSVKQRLESYEETCENLGRCLASEEYNHNRSRYNNSSMTYIVIYMLNPGPHMSSYLDMCRCFYKLKEEYRKIAGNSVLNHYGLVLQLVPIDHVLSPSAFGGYAMLGMKDIAFSVYTKCLNVISRKVNPMVTTDLYAPTFILEKPLQKTIQFKLNDIRPFPVILDQNASLQMAYCFSYDRAWMSAVWIDSRGELLEYALFPRKSAFKEAWERTLKIAKQTDFPWTIVVTKIGLLFHEELVHWLKYISCHNKNKYWVTIVTVDFESGLNLHFNPSSCFTSKEEQSKSESQTPTLLDSYGRFPHQQQQKREQKQQTEGACEAQCLLLNHRISYSQKRERAFKGILRTEAVTEKESWMTPLATGYLIHHSLLNNNINPCMEQFTHESFIAEIHLLYNHTPHSAYSMLQDIIKMMYKLSFVNPIPSSSGHHCLPFHIVLAERLSRLLLIVDDSLK